MDKAKDAEPIIRKACQMNQRTLPSDLGLVRHAEKQKLLKDGQQPSFIHLFKTKELRLRYGTLLVIWVGQDVKEDRPPSDSDGFSLLRVGDRPLGPVLPGEICLRR